MEIYKILQDIMIEKSLTIPDVARACSLSDSTVRGIIVRRQQSVALEVAFKLSKGLGISLERLNGDFANASGNDDSYLDAEKNIIKKYRRLDARGRAAVLDSLERELQFSDGVRLNEICGDVAQSLQDVQDKAIILKQNTHKSKK